MPPVVSISQFCEGEAIAWCLWREEMSPVAGISQFCEREAMVGCLWAPLKDGGRRQGL